GRGTVEQIRQAPDRAAGLTRQLLAFSRKQIVEPRVLDLRSLLGEIDKMLRRLIGEDIELTASHEEGLGQVKVDPGQIEQVVMNLVVNARDAMPAGGRIRIRTANTEIDEAWARNHAGAQPGSFVLLEVTDNGMGMDAEIRSHIFEPFFTTKEPGRGTGLGLAMVYGIVKQCGGYIDVVTERGRGAAFSVYLPRVDDPVAAAGPRADARAASSGTETILVVEDEEAVLSLIGEGLRGRGFTVIETRDASEALEICVGRGARVDLVLTDVILRGISGPEMAARLAKARPDLKVLFMSGYADHPWLRDGVQ